MTNIKYISIDNTHRIEFMPSGGYYPQVLANPQFGDRGWGYYKQGNKQWSFKTERGARGFLATAKE